MPRGVPRSTSKSQYYIQWPKTLKSYSRQEHSPKDNAQNSAESTDFANLMGHSNYWTSRLEKNGISVYISTVNKTTCAQLTYQYRWGANTSSWYPPVHVRHSHFTDLCDSHSAQRSTTPLSVYVSKYCRIPIGRVVRDVRVLKLSTQIAWLLAQGITLCRLSVIVNAYTITLFELWTIFVHRHILLWVRGENNQARLIYYNTRRLNFMHNYIVRQ